MTIRHPRRGDILPIPLEFTGRIDPEWVWLMGNAILIAAPAHDAVMLLRLIRFGEMPPLWMHRLFRQVLKECRARGYGRFLTWLAADVEEEQKLKIIARRAGATFVPFRGEIAMGVI
jgi:hypothetical protein